MSKLTIQLETINAIAEQVRAEHPDDPELLADMLEAETDLHGLLSWAYGKLEAEQASINALKEQESNRASRRKSAEGRKNTMRGIIMALLNAAGQDKVTLPEATFSRRKVPPKPVVKDADKLPDDLCTFTRKPNMAAIKALPTLHDGVVMDNGGVSLSIRTK